MIGRVVGLLGKLALLGVAYYAVSNGALTFFAADPVGGAQVVIVSLVGLTLGVFISREFTHSHTTSTALAHPQFAGVVRAATPEEMRADEGSRPRRARHEAAHAVVAHHVGMLNVRADLHTIGASGGNTSYQHSSTVRLVDLEYSSIMISLAGQVLDFAGGHHDYGAKGDIEKATESAITIISAGEHPATYRGPLTLDGLIRQARIDTERLLADHRDAVDRITEALLQRTSLDVDDLKQLVDQAAAMPAGTASIATTGKES